MEWKVLIHEEFDPELKAMEEELRDELLAQAKALKRFGPSLGRPRVDTLNGSRYPNMKELRFSCAGGVWRVAFAFDPARSAILLIAGDKAGLWGKSEKRFYKKLIEHADERYSRHLAKLDAKEV